MGVGSRVMYLVILVKVAYVGNKCLCLQKNCLYIHIAIWNEFLTVLILYECNVLAEFKKNEKFFFYGFRGTDKLSMGKPYRYLNGKYMYVIRENLDIGKFNVTTV